MGQTVIKVLTGETYGSAHWNSSQIGNGTKTSADQFGYDHGVQRPAMTFPSLASQGLDFSKVEITGLTLNLNNVKGTYKGSETFLVAISNTINYNTYGNSGGRLKTAVEGITTKETNIGKLSNFKIGVNNVSLNYNNFKGIIENDIFFVYLNYDNPNGVNANSGCLYIGGSDTANYATLTVDWEYLSSSFTANSIITMGENYSIALNLNNTSYTHKALFQVNSQTYDTWDFAAGMATKTQKVNDAVLNAIPITTDRVSGSLIVITYSNGAELGRESKTVTFIIPRKAPYIPSGTFTLTSSDGDNAYVDRTTWTFSLSLKADDAILSSATLQSWHVYRRDAQGNSYGDWYENITGDKRTYTATGTSPSVSKESTYTWYAEATNSRGVTVSIGQAQVVIGEQTYERPIKFIDVSAYRTDINGDEKAEGTYYKLRGTITATSKINSIVIDGYTYYPNSTSYDLSNVSQKAVGTSDLTASKNIPITVNATGASITQTIVLLSAAYMLYFKKGGGALGVGKVVDNTDNNLMDVGWKTRISYADSEGILNLNSLTSNVENSILFSVNGKYLWKIGYNNDNAFVIQNNYYTNPPLTLGMFDNKITIRNNNWRMIFGGDNIMFYHKDGNEYELSKDTGSGRLITNSINTDFTITKYAARIFLRNSTTSTETQGEILTVGNGLLFRNADVSNPGLLYDEYVFPSRTSGTTTKTYTVYTTKNIIYNSSQPTTASTGDIWLQPIS